MFNRVRVRVGVSMGLGTFTINPVNCNDRLKGCSAYICSNVGALFVSNLGGWVLWVIGGLGKVYFCDSRWKGWLANVDGWLSLFHCDVVSLQLPIYHKINNEN